ncbi:hypothetical protein ACFUTX_00095 [Microbacterium sp. NPDC057407]|uniref:hypothetical protein n=1 Tax=Microbacterium sp. NPDC057407 TaxID=3346120 RepID=UPI00366E41DE
MDLPVGRGTSASVLISPGVPVFIDHLTIPDDDRGLEGNGIEEALGCDEWP